MKMTRNNTVLLVITGSITSKFENLSGKVFEFEYGSEIKSDKLTEKKLLNETKRQPEQ